MTVAVLLQSLSALVSPGLASQADAKFTLLLALLCFTVAAISGAITNPLGPATSSAELTAANSRSTGLLTTGVGFDVVGMGFLALTAVLFVF